MSRGMGLVQHALIAAFQIEPGQRFTVEELVEIAFPDEAIELKHLSSVRRALKNLTGLDLHLPRPESFAPVVGVTSRGARDKRCFLCSELQSVCGDPTHSGLR
jgi:hypothetical protein